MEQVVRRAEYAAVMATMTEAAAKALARRTPERWPVVPEAAAMAAAAVATMEQVVGLAKYVAVLETRGETTPEAVTE